VEGDGAAWSAWKNLWFDRAGRCRFLFNCQRTGVADGWSEIGRGRGKMSVCWTGVVWYIKGDRVEEPPGISENPPSLAGFFMKFRGRNAHPNRPGGLSYLQYTVWKKAFWRFC
jgi:hypothetical protein